MHEMKISQMSELCELLELSAASAGFLHTERGLFHNHSIIYDHLGSFCIDQRVADVAYAIVKTNHCLQDILTYHTV